MTGPGGSAEYVYDALGRRMAKVVDGVTTYFVYNAVYQVVEERDAQNQLTARYVYGAGIDEPLTMERDGTLYTYHRDALGSITEVTNAAGNLVERYEYDVYGTVTIFDNMDMPLTESAIANPYLFTGRRYDPESGNYYYRARIYSPTLGRFLQTDPLGYIDSLNLYAYVGNNPLRYTDPTGLLFGPDDVFTGPFDEMLFLWGLGGVMSLYCQATGCDAPDLMAWLPPQNYNPPPYEPVPGPTPGIPGSEPVDTGISPTYGGPEPEMCQLSGPEQVLPDNMPDTGMNGTPIPEATPLEPYMASPENIENHHKVPWNNKTYDFQNHPLVIQAGENLKTSKNNQMPLGNHRSRHSPEYHQAVQDMLDAAYQDVAGQGQQAAQDALNEIYNDIETGIVNGTLRPYRNKDVWIP